jgi:hypothetical protein
MTDENVTSITVRVINPPSPEAGIFAAPEPGAVLTFRGRVAWALLGLIRAGERGITPSQRPAPRWSDYIFRLRGAGIVVETINEPHGSTYAGHHARYVLRTPLVIEGIEFAGGVRHVA